jgi:hypothetical protein
MTSLGYWTESVNVTEFLDRLNTLVIVEGSPAPWTDGVYLICSIQLIHIVLLMQQFSNLVHKRVPSFENSSNCVGSHFGYIVIQK